MREMRGSRDRRPEGLAGRPGALCDGWGGGARFAVKVLGLRGRAGGSAFGSERNGPGSLKSSLKVAAEREEEEP